MSLESTTTDDNEEEIDPKLKQLEEFRLIDDLKTRLGVLLAQSEEQFRVVLTESAVFIGTEMYQGIKKTEYKDSNLEFESHREKRLEGLRKFSEYLVSGGPIMSMDQSVMIYFTINTNSASNRDSSH